MRKKVDEVIEEINGISFINDDNKNEFTKDIIELTDNFSIELQSTIKAKINSLVTDEQENLYNELIKIIEDRIGDIYSQEWIDEVQKEGEERFENSIPPGFDDKNKEENDSSSQSTRRYGNILYQRKFGDLLIWKDIMEYAKKNKKGKKVIFVTDDGKSGKKNDLLYKFSGVTVGPHIYLMNELHINCQKELYILNNLRFIQLVNNLTDEQINSLKININKTNNTYARNDYTSKKVHFINEFINTMNDPAIPLSVREKMFDAMENVNIEEASIDDLETLYLLNLSCKSQINKRNALVHKKFNSLEEDSKRNLEKYLVKSIMGKKNTGDLNILENEYKSIEDNLNENILKKMTSEELNELLENLSNNSDL